MDCYDCLSEGRTTTAAAVCARCGAGLCVDHVHRAEETVHEPQGTGRTTRPGARRLTCQVCARAET